MKISVPSNEKKRSTVFVGRLLKEFPFHISTIQGMQF